MGIVQDTLCAVRMMTKRDVYIDYVGLVYLILCAVWSTPSLLIHYFSLE